MTRLLALLEDPEGPSARLRFQLHRPALEAEGVKVEVEGIPRRLRARWRLLRRAAGADVVFVQRRLLPAWQVRALARRSRRLVFDLDDAVGLRDRPPFHSTTRRHRLGAWLNVADTVVVGSRSLLEHVARARGSRIWIPTTVPDPGPPPETAEPGRVLWLGQPSTFRYLEARAGFLREAERRHPGLRWVLLGAPRGADLGLLRAEVPTWSLEQEERELRRAAIGLAPLPDDPWTRGKCGARMHRYLSHGVATLASAVGVQAELAEGGAGVRLVGDDEEDWMAGLEQLMAASPSRGAVHAAWAERYAPERWFGPWREAVLGPGLAATPPEPGLRACTPPRRPR